MCEGSPVIIKELHDNSSLKANLTVGTVVTELGNQNAVGIIGSWDGKGQMMAPNHQRQSGCGSCKEEQSQSSNKNSLSCTDLWHWLVDHGIPRSEIDRKLTTSFDL